MKYSKVAALIPICFALSASAAVRYVDLNCPQPVSPYTDWSTAATNIQDAIDASVDGDFIWVTNGVYANGGKVMSGDLTNRVTLDKAVTVQSVNGPWVTTIQGAGATNGTSAVRCAWLTNSAILQGFTLRAGATRYTGDATTYNGGAAWCASSNSILANCLIISNTAGSSAGGAYQGTLRNCGLIGNLKYAAHTCVMYNCTVVNNFLTAVYASTLTNCIVYSNPQGNSLSSTFAYCCTVPLPPGPGNTSADPQLLPDNLHLTSTSPCRGAGLNLTTGTDIDGQSWSNPPSMGCDEWQPAPIVPVAPLLQLTYDPVGFTVSATVVGQTPFACLWLRNGVPIQNDSHFSSADTTNLVAAGVGPLDAGAYQLVVSNAWGMSTSAVAKLVTHYVNAASANPTFPYTDWSTAAATIQDAIDAALPGEVVLVTNGVYATGGKPWGGALTNRVVLNKALLVQSVNGPGLTIIEGANDPSSTNGPLAIRCAWLTNAATLSGFTLRGGATLGSSTSGNSTDQSGGGVWGSATNLNRLPSSIVANCVIANSTASSGGGASTAVLINCRLVGNAAIGNGTPFSMAATGGGADSCTLKNCVVAGNLTYYEGGGTFSGALINCAVVGNTALNSGGGCYYGALLNCTVTGNTAGTASRSGWAGGVYYANLTNSIVYGNQALGFSYSSQSNYSLGTFTFTCTSPLPSGAGNISSNPQLFADGIHLNAASPCRGAGAYAFVVGTDIDGQAWANPPSMGCDEWWPAPALIGPPQLQASGVPAALNASASVAGQPPYSFWWLKDGALLDDNSHYAASHSGNLVVSNFGPADVGGYQVIVSNAFGIVISAVAQVVVHCANPAGLSPLAPYSDWSTAATSLQDAVDAALAGEFVLAANGVFNTGGRPVGTGITNRVVIPRPIEVIGINGPGATAITGAWDPTLTNGPASIRGVWLADGATLSGFTVQNGSATDYGGGVYAASTNAVLINCVLTNNQASMAGGGCYQGLITKCTLVANQSNNEGGGAYQSLIASSLVSNNWARVGGGGTYYCTIFNSVLCANATPLHGGGSYQDTIYGSLISGNSAPAGGGGAYSSSLYNCAVTSNHASQSAGGGTYLGTARNSIIYFNDSPFGFPNYQNYSGSGLSYCCTTPAPAGTGNITSYPQLLDGVHISTISPCRGAGSATYASGTDIDGEPWASTPSIGCDEVWEAALTGPLSVSLTPKYTTVAQYGQDSLLGQVIGRPSRVAWDFGDGTGLTNISSMGYPKVWTNPGDYTVTFTAFNTDNPTGVSTNTLIHVLPLVNPSVTSSGFSGKTFTLNFYGQAGVNYVLDETTSLVPPVAWNPIWYVFGNATNTQAIDYSASDPARFYRLRVQPWGPPPF